MKLSGNQKINYSKIICLNSHKMEKKGKSGDTFGNEKMKISYCLLAIYLDFGNEIRGCKIFSSPSVILVCRKSLEYRSEEIFIDSVSDNKSTIYKNEK